DQGELPRFPAAVPAGGEEDDGHGQVRVPHPQEPVAPAPVPEPHSAEARHDVVAEADEQRRERAPDHAVDVDGTDPAEGEPGTVAEELGVGELGGQDDAHGRKDEQPEKPAGEPPADHLPVDDLVVEAPRVYIHRLASPPAAARTTRFTDSPRLRLRLALPDSQTRLASGCGSRYQIHRLASPPAAARATTFTATVAISREANGVRGLESPPEVVRQDDPEPALGAGAKSERDEGMIAEGGGQREPTDRRVPVEDVQLLQIEGLPGLDELPLPELQPRSARVLDLDLDVDDLAGPDPAIGDELRDPDRGRAELVGARLARRR